jgi:hypothetical protein
MSFLVNPYSYSGCTDADALAFLTATGITDATITSAICTLVTSMKTDGTWAKCSAIYPMVGGTATTHKFNLKNPLDTNVAFRLSFVGGWTHSSGGALPNGTNAYADTFLNPSTSLTANSGSLSYYSRTNSATILEVPFGNINGLNGSESFNLVLRRNDNLFSFRATQLGAATGLVNSTTTDSRGLSIGSITSSISRKIYKNASLINTNTTNLNWSRFSASIYLGAGNDFATMPIQARFFTNKQCAFASIGSGLSDTEAAALYNSIQAMQTTLARNV